MRDLLKNNPVFWVLAMSFIIVVGRGLWVYLCPTDTTLSASLEELPGVLIPVGTGLLLALNAVILYTMQLDKNDKDAFKGAVEHLGHKSESVRLGGIYALYGLAPKPRYKKDVHEILCAHIRNKTSEDNDKDECKYEPSTEIQTLLELLTSKQKNQVFIAAGKPLKVNLRGACLQGADLQGVGLQGAQLQGADLRHVQLQGADLRRAQLQRANFQNAQLQGVFLRNAQLQGAYLWDAQLQGAILLKAKLQGAILWDAQLQGARLGDAQLQGAFLRNAQLQGANLQGAQLQGAHSTEIPTISDSDHRIMAFAKRIRAKVVKNADMKTVVFVGGMSPEWLESIESNIDIEAVYWDKDSLRRSIKEYLESLLQWIEDDHVDKPQITGADKRELSKHLKGAKTGSYTAEEAEQWIAEYNKAMNSQN